MELDKLLGLNTWIVHTYIHDYFFRRFDEVLLALKKKDKISALNTFFEASTLLLHHIKFESEHILPYYEKLDIYNEHFGAYEHFFSDHKRLKDQIPELFLEIIFDSGNDQAIFKLSQYFDLLKHHDERETEILYPVLEQFLDDISKKEILKKFEKHLPIKIENTIDWKRFIRLSKKWKQYRNIFLFNDSEFDSSLYTEFDNLISHKGLCKKFKILLKNYHPEEEYFERVMRVKKMETLVKTEIKFLIKLDIMLESKAFKSTAKF
jgi:hemerythrin-like domain-containing protein